MTQTIELYANGRVTDEVTKRPLSDLLVELVDRSPSGDVVITSGNTATDGTFRFVVDNGAVRTLLTSRREAYFRVSNGTETVLDLPERPRWSPSTAGTAVDLLVSLSSDKDDRTGEDSDDKTARMEGRVLSADGYPVPDATVRVRQHRDFGKTSTDLCAAQTDEAGHWILSYAPLAARVADGNSVLLEVRAELADVLIASSGLIADPPPFLRVLLKSTSPISIKVGDHAAIVTKTTKLLQDTPLRSLSKTGQQLMARQTKVPLADIARAVKADDLAHASGPKGAAIVAAHYYGLTKHGLPVNTIGAGTVSSAKLTDIIEAATAAGDLPSMTKPEQEDVRQSLKTIAAHDLLTSADNGPTFLATMLTPVLSAPQRSALAKAWVEYPDAPASVWTSLQTDPAFTGEDGDVQLAGAKITIQLGKLTDRSLPVMAVLRTAAGVGGKVEAVAGRPQSWWEARLGEIPDAKSTWLPPDPALSEGARITRYAAELRRRADQAFPSAQLTRRIVDDPDSSSELISAVQLDGFSIATQRVSDYIAAEHATVEAEAQETLTTYQRLAALDPSFDTILTLVDANYTAAEHIVMSSPAQFAAATPSLTVEARDHIYNAAQLQVLTGVAVQGEIEHGGGLLLPGIIQVSPPVSAPSLATLFGDLGGCECDGCDSVLSPSAYLVDLASYLKSDVRFNLGAGIFVDGWSALSGRRPDLADSRLNCENTQTVLPYLDLVNEILERSIASGSLVYRASDSSTPIDASLDPASGPPPQLPLNPGTSAEQLGAYPQDTWYPALRALAAAPVRFSTALPFDRPTVEARLYLNELGPSLARILEVTAAPPPSDHLSTQALDRATALEILGLTEAEAAPFEQSSATPVNWESAWGVGSPDPRTFAVPIGGTGIFIDPLLQRLELTVEQLKAIAGTKFVQRFATLSFTLPDDCRTAGLIGTLTASGSPTQDALRNAIMEGLHRFNRLQKKLGWTTQEVDLALQLFLGADANIPAISLEAWAALAETVRWCRELKVRPIELLACWSSPVDAGEYSAFTAPVGLPSTSLFSSLFVDRTARTDDDDYFAALPPAPASPTTHPPFDNGRLRTILGVLGLSTADLPALATVPPGLPDGDFGLDPYASCLQTIWRWYSRSRLARALRLPVQDACWLMDRLAGGVSGTTNMLPYGTAGWERFGNFVRLARLWKSLRWSAADAAYLLTNNADVTTARRPTAAGTEGFLTKLRAALKKVTDTTLPFPSSMSDEEIAAGITLALQYFMHPEAAETVASMLGGALPTTGFARSFLDEALRRVLWQSELTYLRSMPFGDAGQLAARRRYLLGRLQASATLPDVPLAPQTESLFHLDDPELAGRLKQILWSWLSASNDTEMDAKKAIVETIVDALTGGTTLAGIDGATVAAELWGTGFWTKLTGLPADETRELCALRVTFLRMSLQRRTDPSSILTLLNHLQDTLLPSGDMGLKTILNRLFRTDLAGALVTVSAGDFAQQEVRTDTLLLASNNPLESYYEAVNDGVPDLAAQAVGLPRVGLNPMADPLAFLNRFKSGLDMQSWKVMGSSSTVVTAEELAYLGLADHVAEILPSSPDTEGDRVANRVRFSMLLDVAFREQLRDANTRFALRDQYTSSLGAPLNTVNALLSAVEGVPAGGAPTPTIEQVFLNAAFLEPGSFPQAAIDTDERLRKAAAVVGALGLRAEELLVIDDANVTRASEYPDHESWVGRGLLSVKNLPVGSTTLDAGAKQDGVLRMLRSVEVASFRRSIIDPLGSPYDLLDLVHASSTTGLAALTGWEAGSGDVFVTPAFSSGSMPVAYDVVAPRILRRIQAQGFQDVLGVHRADLLSWADGFRSTSADSFSARLGAAQAIRVAGRAHVGEESWLARSRPLIDRLRQAQRDALVAYHITTDKLSVPDDLVARKLIDTQMSCCMMTTRTLQAVAAVQLFAHRCLMHLESNSEVTPEGVTRWEWMKQYRLWEANRKVFLYPENWIDPTLRRDKTPLFKEFENRLQASDLDDASIEAALEGYLRGLDSVARLDVRAFTVEQTEDKTLHVIGRSVNPPYVYWYRRRERGTHWTPWEKLDVPIEGDSVTAAVINRRLHLFWLRCETRSLQLEGADAKDPPVDQLFYQVVFVRREGEGWSHPRYSKDKLEGDQNNPNLATRLSLSVQSPLAVMVDLRSGEAEVPALIHVVVGWQGDAIYNMPRRGYSLCWVLASFAFRNCTGELEVNAGAEVRELLITQTHLGFALSTSTPGVRDFRYVAWGPAGFGAKPNCGDQCMQLNRNDELTLSLPRANSSVGDSTPLMTTPAPLLPTEAAWRVTVDRCLVTDEQNRTVGDHPVIVRDGYQTFLVEALDCHCEGTGIANADAMEDAHIEVPVLTAQAGGYTLPPISSIMLSRRGSPSGGGGPEFIVDGINLPDEVMSFTNASGVGGDSSLFDAAGALMTSQQFMVMDTGPGTKEAARLGLIALHHRKTCSLLEALESGGIDGLYNRDLQFPVAFQSDGTPTDITARYQVQDVVWSEERPNDDDLDFETGTPFGIYNAEVFFHIPALVAYRLNADLRFEKAREWMHRIFSPLTAQAPSPPALNTWSAASDWGARPAAHFWNYRPFLVAELGERDERMNAIVQFSGDSTQANRSRRRFLRQLGVWLENPFDPHAIAAVRPRAYEFATVMSYIDNLLDWGDTLFRSDTRESIDEATILYIYAASLLGRRPALSAPLVTSGTGPTLSAVLTGLRTGTGDTLQEDLAGRYCTCETPQPEVDAKQFLFWQQFCRPVNDNLRSYWDRVADRLFKIRNCLDIEGIQRDLPLFEPPIDPALLVRAATLGVSLGSALSQGVPTLTTWRFQTLLQRALEYTGDVRSLGGQLLAALEKKDAEELTQVRSAHEFALLQAGRVVRQRQIDEANQQIAVLEGSYDLAKERHDYYAGLEKQSDEESLALDLNQKALIIQAVSQGMSLVASGLSAIPDFEAGTAGLGPLAASSYGGSNLGPWMEGIAKTIGIIAQIGQGEASIIATEGSYERRWTEWKFQERLALKEMEQVNRQKVAAQIRSEVAQHELANFEQQIENARSVDEYLRTKFSRTELYSWMVGELTALYRDSYQMAFDLARRAERAYQFERLQPAPFISFGQWDNLKSGLLAGEKLHHDLRRLEKDYQDTERREYELTRHFSLAQIDPFALLRLRDEGMCEIDLTEDLFDRDFPGHYFRRIKTVSLTIPAVVGPYAGVHARLTLIHSSIRQNADLGSDFNYHEDGSSGPNADARFVYDPVPVQSIVTSGAQADSGVFQLDLRSDRMMPFEGAGAISRWRLELDPLSNSFDPRTLTDVVLHLQYTAREGGRMLQQAAADSLRYDDGSSGSGDYHLRPGMRYQMVSLAQNAPDEFHQFRTTTADARTITPGVMKTWLGYVPRAREAVLETMWVVFLLDTEVPGMADIPFALKQGSTTLTSTFQTVIPGGMTAGNGTPVATYIAEFTPPEGVRNAITTTADWHFELPSTSIGGPLGAKLLDVIFIMKVGVAGGEKDH
jgi:hypothetical protein